MVDRIWQKLSNSAINDWEKALGGVEFKYIKDDSEADVEIEFKKGKGKKVGKTVTFFDYLGFIDQVDISISKKSYGFTLDKRTFRTCCQTRNRACAWVRTCNL